MPKAPQIGVLPLFLLMAGGVLHAASNPTLTLSELLGGSKMAAYPTTTEAGTFGTAVAVDSAGNIYVTGSTLAIDFPVLNALQPTCLSKYPECPPKIFIAKFSANGTLIYSTFLGGSAGGDGANAIAVDSTGAVYITGSTFSSDFPVVNPLQSTNPNCALTTSCTFGSRSSTSFVAKLNPAGTALVYSTYLGGTGSIFFQDAGTGIAVDAAGNAYVVGKTASPNMPLVNPVVSSLKGSEDGYVVKLNASGSAILFSTYLGGSGAAGALGTGTDQANAIALDAAGNMYVTGATSSKDFPVVGGVQSQYGGAQNAFVTKISPAFKIVYSTYLGGSSVTSGNGIAVDSAGAAYITGVTTTTQPPPSQPGFPLVHALQNTFGGATDAFVSKLDPTGATLVYSTYLGGSSADSGSAIAVDASGIAYVAGTTGSLNFPVANALQSTRGGLPSQTSSTDTNAFLSAFSADGTQLVYSTYLGGSSLVTINGNSGVTAAAVTVDSSAQVYVAGSAGFGAFPTLGPVPTEGPNLNAFIARITNAATSVPCVYTPSVGTVTIPAAGGTGNFVMAGNSNACSWQATSNASWLTITGGASGSGIGNVVFTAPANPGLAAQTTTISVAGQTVTVTQQPPDQVATASSNGIPGGLARIPLTLIVDPENFCGPVIGNISSITTTISIIPVGSAPPITAPLGFLQDPAMPVPNFSGVTGEISVGWPSPIPTLIAGTIKLGEVLVTLPAGASVGQSYTVHGGSGLITGCKNEGLPAGPDTVLSVANPAPVATWMTPANGAPGTSALTLTVYGQGFVPTSSVLWSGSVRATTFVSETQLQAAITAADLATAGSAQVTVTNPAPAGGQSAALKFTITAATPPSISTGGVVDSAAYGLQVSGDTIVSIFGVNFGSSTAQATALPLPTQLNGVSVLVDGVPAPLFYVSPMQINLQMPWRLLNQTQTVVAVSVNGLASNAITVPLAVRPVIFAVNSQGTGQGAILDGVTGELMAPVGSIPGVTSKPAVAGEIVSIYCTGMGAVTNESSLIDGVSFFEFTRLNESVQGTVPKVTIGGVAAVVNYSGLAPAFVGLYQVNVTVPSGVSGSAVPVVFSINNTVSNTVTMAVQSP